MTSTAIKLYWNQIKLFAKQNWKYAIAFAVGSLASTVFAFHFVKSLTGYSTKELILRIVLKMEERKYSNIRNYNAVSVRPSSAFMAFDALVRSNPIWPLDYTATKQECIKQLATSRKRMNDFIIDRMLPPFMKDPKVITINNKTKGYLLTYPGCSISNGIVVHFHSGGCFLGEPKVSFPYLTVIQQYLGCLILSIDYGLCPENNSYPTLIDECIASYKYVLNEMNINSKQILFCGESAGGSICLSILQKLNQLSLQQPCGACIISPVVDWSMSMALNTQENGGINDALFKVCPAMCAAFLVDNNDRKSDQNMDNIENDMKILKTAKYSPLNGDWKGLCPLYLSASLNEVLINDAKAVIEKCKQFGVEIEYKFDEYLCHCPPATPHLYPESRDSLIVMIQWMKRIFNT
eukprot:211165_1